MTKTRLRIGLLRLADSAPVLFAQQAGLFARLGLAVEIRIEPSWANIADKLAYGLLDAAVMLPPLALASALGLRRPATRLVVPMGLTLGGNSVALAPAAAAAVGAADDALAAGRRLLAWARAQPAPPRFAVVHAFSTHHLLLRYWLAAAGGDPATDLHIEIIPPEQVVAALRAGRIAGFCAGAPWGDAAQAQQAGQVLLGSSAIWAHHPEKCLAVTQGWAQAHPEGLTALLRALLQSGLACDRPETAPILATLLEEAGVAAPRAALLAALPGGAGRERIGFHAGAAWFPWRSHAAWFLGQMHRWGWLAETPALAGDAPPAEAGPADAGLAHAGSAHAGLAEVARAVYRPDLLAPAALAEGLDWPAVDAKPEGGHAAVWHLPAAPLPLEIQADIFCDGAVFD